MNNPAISKRTSLAAVTFFLLLAIACGQTVPTAAPTRTDQSPQPPPKQAASIEQTGAGNVVVIRNHGGAMPYAPGFSGDGHGVVRRGQPEPEFS